MGVLPQPPEAAGDEDGHQVPQGDPAEVSLLTWAFADDVALRVFSVRQLVRLFVRAESALAIAQARAGVIKEADADAIASALKSFEPDWNDLREQTRNVGYPILPLVRQLVAQLPPGPDGRLHLGATTQDIMDSALALQLKEGGARIVELTNAVGTALDGLAAAHAGTVIAGRTHGQQAVPTTFGAKLAVFLTELSRESTRLINALDAAVAVSLFGAAGTSAALGSTATATRQHFAEILGLRAESIPWHADRDAVANLMFQFVALANTCRRIALETINLSRTEIGELSEREGHHRGASSTMPQKRNPIASEVVVGCGTAASAMMSGLLDATGHVVHERASGEWQAEWFLIPHLTVAAATALRWTAELLEGLMVDEERMRNNLRLDGGSVAAEALMIHLAATLGREAAHDLVYDAVRDVRDGGGDLFDAVSDRSGVDVSHLREPGKYVGEASEIVARARGVWSDASRTLASWASCTNRRGPKATTE